MMTRSSFAAEGRSCASRLLKAVGRELPVDVEALARAQGAEVVPVTRMTPAARLTTFGGLLIEVHEGQRLEQQRTAICHEIAHTFFTSGAGARFTVSSTEGLLERDEEYLCDLLALDLLMPEVAFGEQLVDRVPSWAEVQGLADSFGTTPWAVVRRLRQFTETPWCGLLLLWEPVDALRPFEGFTVVKRDAFGEVATTRLPRGHRSLSRELYLSYRKTGITTHSDFGCTLESFGVGRGNRRRVFSFVTLKPGVRVS